MPSENAKPPSRAVDLAEVLLDLADLLDEPRLDAYLFGSRRFGTGSIRSDLDLLIRVARTPDHDQMSLVRKLEPYLDIFVFDPRGARSLINDSMISAGNESELLTKLEAMPVVLGGTWQEHSGIPRLHKVLDYRAPMATNARMFHDEMSMPGNRADILVVTALSKEFLAAVGVLGATRDRHVARAETSDRYGDIWLTEIVLINQMGSVGAALETAEALRRTKPMHVVLLGIAAGFPGKVELGDVVIPEQVVYYEGQKIRGRKVLGAPTWKATSEQVRRVASTAPFLAGLGPPLDRVRIHSDVVLACGEKVVASSRFRRRLAPSHRKMAALDMESYGVACAAEKRNIPVTIIKAICDFADQAKNDDMQEPAAQYSARAFKVLLQEGAFRLVALD